MIAMSFLSAFTFFPYSTITINQYLDEDSPFISCIDETGQHYLLGTIRSEKNNVNQSDIFIEKLSENFSRELYRFTIGGAGDEYVTDAIYDNGKIYICGSTRSIDFPVTENALYRTLSGLDDGFLLILDAETGTIDYCTYFGGDLMEYCSALCKKDSKIYVTGTTWSSSFPITENAFQKRLYGTTDGFYLCFDDTTNKLVYSTYFGGSNEEFASDICLVDGMPYMVGRTSSHDYPLSDTAYNSSFNGGQWDLYLVSFSDIGTPTYSTYLGGSRNDFVSKMVSSDSQLYITGRTYSGNFPVTPDAIQLEMHDLSDAYLVHFDTSLQSVAYASFFGGDKTEYPFSLLVHDNILYVAGKTFSTNHFPITSNARQKTFAGGWSDGFLLCLDKTNNHLVYSSYVGGADRDSIDSICISKQENNLFFSGRTMSPQIPAQAITFIQNDVDEINWNGFIMRYNNSVIK